MVTFSVLEVIDYNSNVNMQGGLVSMGNPPGWKGYGDSTGQNKQKSLCACRLYFQN